MIVNFTKMLANTFDKHTITLLIIVHMFIGVVYDNTRSTIDYKYYYW